VLADVHGNAPALAAVLTEAERAQPDRFVPLGDLTWGSFPAETLELDGLGPTGFCHGSLRSVDEPVTEATPGTRLREPEVEFRRTGYDVHAVVERMRRSGESVEEELAQLLLEPLSRAEAVANPESAVFTG